MTEQKGKQEPTGQEGFVLALTVLILAVAAVIVPPFLSYTHSALATVKDFRVKAEAQQAAQAGVYGVYAEVCNTTGGLFPDEGSIKIHRDPSITRTLAQFLGQANPPESTYLNGFNPAYIDLTVENFDTQVQGRHPGGYGYGVTCRVRTGPGVPEKAKVSATIYETTAGVGIEDWVID
ncbi:MAG: hypothetical protein NTU41_02705 [Chloroflexi bacterium]|nr:hypothetical protein [Chloroflexota bacterium]